MKQILFAGVLAAALAPLAAQAASGADILSSQCAGCHALTKPAAADLTIDRLMTRKGPDLYYAGVKFNHDWLVSWLQNPTPIRPGGVMFLHYVHATSATTADAIDTSKIPPHPKLDAAQAAAAADALMALGKDSGLVTKGAFKHEPPNAFFGALLFNKLRGCSSCHSGKPGTGGFSGPELYDAGARLQPDYIVEYIRDPQKFDPHVWMPKLGLKDEDIQKLTGYILTLDKGGAK